MNSREEITHLMNQYGFRIDTGDLEGFTDLFAHAEWTIEGSKPNHGKQDLLDNMVPQVKIYPDGTPRTKHITTNVDISINEEKDTATGQCYVTVMQQTDEFPLQAIFSGHYFDEFERVGGKWRFSKRIIKYILVGNLSAHVNAPSNVVPAA